MSNYVRLLVAMAEECREIVLQSASPGIDQPPSLQPKHLAWMCNEILEHVDQWPQTKMHRWIGFIQGGMIANGMLDLNGAKKMFDKAKIEFGEPDEDLLDHLDPKSSFEFDIGGQG